MGHPDLKQKIQLQIENADERLLRIVSSVCDNYLNERADLNKASEAVVAYDVEANPLTLRKYNAAIDKGIDDFEKGKFISHEALLEEIKSWRNEV